MQAIGDDVTWYTDATGGTPLSAVTPLVSGTYYASQSVGICESDRVAVAVTIAPVTSNATTETACGTFTWDVNGMTYTDSGIYTDQDGCHTETLNLTITSVTSTTITETACGTFTWDVNGAVFTESGSYDYTFECNTVTLELTIVPDAVLTSQPQDTSVTEGAAVTFTAAVSGGISFQWQRSEDGVSWNDVAEGAGYTGTQSVALTLDAAIVNAALNGTKFRLQVDNGVCATVFSDAATLSVLLGTTSFASGVVRIYPNPTREKCLDRDAIGPRESSDFRCERARGGQNAAPSIRAGHSDDSSCPGRVSVQNHHRSGKRRDESRQAITTDYLRKGRIERLFFFIHTAYEVRFYYIWGVED